MQEGSGWATFPKELLAHTFGFLDLSSLCQCFTVNKQWHAASLEDSLWQHLFQSTFLAQEDGPSKPWKQRFKERAQRPAFCFHPLVTDRAFEISLPDFKAVQRGGDEGHNPSAILSTELLLRAVDVGGVSLPPANDNNRTGTMAGLFNPMPRGSQEQPQKKEEGIQKAMFTDWGGKLVELQFRACGQWAVVFCSLTEELFAGDTFPHHHQVVSLCVFGDGTPRAYYPAADDRHNKQPKATTSPPPFLLLECHLAPVEPFQEYCLSVQVDARKEGEETVTFGVGRGGGRKGEPPTLTVPTPPLPFAMACCCFRTADTPAGHPRTIVIEQSLKIL